MYEEKIATVSRQIDSVQKAVAARQVKDVAFVACGGSLATLYPGKYIIERETAAVRASLFNAAEWTSAPPAWLGPESLVILNSQSGTTPETVAAAELCRQRGAMTVAFTAKPGSALEQATEYVVHYFDDPASPYPAALTIFPEVYQLAYALLDVWNETARLPEVHQSMICLQETFDQAVSQYRPAAKAFAWNYATEPTIYTVSAGADACIGYVLTNCLLMESLWKNSAALHAGEFFHGAFEAIDDESAVIALVGLGKARGMEERAVKFLQRKTKKLTVLDAAAIDLEQYPSWLREALASLVLNRLGALFCEETAFVMGHPLSSRRYMGVEKY